MPWFFVSNKPTHDVFVGLVLAETLEQATCMASQVSSFRMEANSSWSQSPGLSCVLHACHVPYWMTTLETTYKPIQFS